MIETTKPVVNMVHALDAAVLNAMSLEEWLEAYSGGWTNEECLICRAAESGEDREQDFDEEAYFEHHYQQYLMSVSEHRRAATTMRYT